ncbi:YbaB/EbfC family nucleoid-associated protein [Nocardia sp. NPDC058666]|uniref:YbaB/EbfC family nucleoid-associated protein n=1 Tax=unclassified Nocardia TaxID=2637762 RepID=UPI0036653A7C
MADRSVDDAASVFDGLNRQMKAIAEVAQQRAQLTATGYAENRRISVTVNADGAVIETKISPTVDDLTNAEIAKAVTSAAQNAAAEVGRKAQELMAPITEQRAKMPKIHELIEGLPDLGDTSPSLPKPSMAPPGSLERNEAVSDSPVFVDAEDHEQWNERRRTSVTDDSW